MEKLLDKNQTILFVFKVNICPAGINCPLIDSVSETFQKISISEESEDFEKQSERLIFDHPMKNCINYHNVLDQRRYPFYQKDKNLLYSQTLNQNCSTNCMNLFEYFYHPLNYKSRKCPKEKCILKKCCPFYHSENENRSLEIEELLKNKKENTNVKYTKISENNDDDENENINFVESILVDDFNYESNKMNLNYNNVSKSRFFSFQNIDNNSDFNFSSTQRNFGENDLISQTHFSNFSQKNLNFENSSYIPQNALFQSNKTHKKNCSFKDLKKKFYDISNSDPTFDHNNVKKCPFFHSMSIDRRRNPSVYKYSSELCHYGDNCHSKDNCLKSHNKIEQLYHIDRYKMKFCVCFPNKIHKCDYGDYCSFAHNENQIKIPLLHKQLQDYQFMTTSFKTVWCPFSIDHDRQSCVYAHNPQDLRRDTRINFYLPVDCSYWKTTTNVMSYEEGGCHYGMMCQKAHGWKEKEYHPLNYKTKPCITKDNCSKIFCPYLHNNESYSDNEEAENILDKNQGKFKM